MPPAITAAPGDSASPISPPSMPTLPPMASPRCTAGEKSDFCSMVASGSSSSGVPRRARMWMCFSGMRATSMSLTTVRAMSVPGTRK